MVSTSNMRVRSRGYRQKRNSHLKPFKPKNERSNLVYAIKIKVKNDGYLKIGMYGEVTFEKAAASK